MVRIDPRDPYSKCVHPSTPAAPIVCKPPMVKLDPKNPYSPCTLPPPLPGKPCVPPMVRIDPRDPYSKCVHPSTPAAPIDPLSNSDDDDVMEDETKPEAKKPTTGFLQMPKIPSINLAQLKLEADQAKLNKLVITLRKYRFDVGIKRAELEESAQENIENIESMMNAITKDIEDMEKRIVALQKELVGVNAEIEKNKNSIKKIDQDIKDLQQRKHDLEIAHNKRQAECRRYLERLKQEEREIKKLMDQTKKIYNINPFDYIF